MRCCDGDREGGVCIMERGVGGGRIDPLSCYSAWRVSPIILLLLMLLSALWDPFLPSIAPCNRNIIFRRKRVASASRITAESSNCTI